MCSPQQDFDQAWNRLVSKGDAGIGEKGKSFTPVGLRHDVKETGPLYHGTKADLPVGALLTPGYPSNYGARRIARYVYLTATLDGAVLAAEPADGEGPGRVYLVEPTGPIEDDPNVTDQKFPGNPSRSYRTGDPLRIIGEVTGWQGHPPAVLDRIRERMRQAAREGIEAINE